MLSKKLEEILNNAFRSAKQQRHEYLTVEHLLLALTEDPEVASVLVSLDADIDTLCAGLAEYIEETTPKIPASADDRETRPTLGFQRVLQRAVFDVKSSGREEVTATSVLVSVFSESDSHAVALLVRQNVARIDVVGKAN